MLLMSGFTMIMSTQYTAVLYLRLHATALEAQRTAVCSAHLRRPPVRAGCGHARLQALRIRHVRNSLHHSLNSDSKTSGGGSRLSIRKASVSNSKKYPGCTSTFSSSRSNKAHSSSVNLVGTCTPP